MFYKIKKNVFVYHPQMSWRPTYRSSKFRNVYGKVGNREHCFDGIPITKNVHDNHFCAINSKFLAVVTESSGGGSFIVIPVPQVTGINTTRCLLLSDPESRLLPSRFHIHGIFTWCIGAQARNIYNENIERNSI